MTEQQDTARREARVRRRLWKQGSLLRKSRARTLSLDNYGGDMIVDANRNFIEGGSRFDLSLDDVERWVVEAEEPDPATLAP